MSTENDKGTEPTDQKTEDVAGLKAALDAERSARKAAEKRASEAEGKVTEFETAALRTRIASEKGLTNAQAKFLAGSTEEEIRAAADELAEAFTPAKPTRGRPMESFPQEGLIPGNSNPDDEEYVTAEEANKVAERIIGGNI